MGQIREQGIVEQFRDEIAKFNMTHRTAKIRWEWVKGTEAICDLRMYGMLGMVLESVRCSRSTAFGIINGWKDKYKGR